MVVDAVTRELEAMPDDLAVSALAALALALAEGLDRGSSLAQMAQGAKELRETMMVLRSLAPPVLAEDDEVDLARKRREQRLAGQAAAGSAASS